mmetsp:Transcript_13234/g.14612  ORF Transcript_13234/g.14612 Transcript_13234/m.14612 type:complete len:296 (+) Transcript_13234:124-1011(+)
MVLALFLVVAILINVVFLYYLVHNADKIIKKAPSSDPKTEKSLSQTLPIKVSEIKPIDVTETIPLTDGKTKECCVKKYTLNVAGSTLKDIEVTSQENGVEQVKYVDVDGKESQHLLSGIPPTFEMATLNVSNGKLEIIFAPTEDVDAVKASLGTPEETKPDLKKSLNEDELLSHFEKTFIDSKDLISENGYRIDQLEQGLSLFLMMKNKDDKYLIEKIRTKTFQALDSAQDIEELVEGENTIDKYSLSYILQTEFKELLSYKSKSDFSITVRNSLRSSYVGAGFNFNNNLDETQI